MRRRAWGRSDRRQAIHHNAAQSHRRIRTADSAGAAIDHAVGDSRHAEFHARRSTARGNQAVRAAAAVEDRRGEIPGVEGEQRIGNYRARAVFQIVISQRPD